MDDRTFVNTPMDKELLEKLDKMAKGTERSRAQFIRLLISQEWNEYEHLQGIEKNFKKQVRQVARS